MNQSPSISQRRERLSAELIGQFSWGFMIIFTLASVCWGLLPYTGHHFVALLFLMVIVLAGLRWQRGPVLMMATMSALLWNFIFIPPQFTLHITNPQDAIMFGLFFVVALSMGHLTTRLRSREQAVSGHQRERERLLAAKHRAEFVAESERLHRTLLDSISHELKTPIAIIRTALDGLDGANPFVQEIVTANRRLQRIVENFLEITRVESEAVRPRLEWCEINDVLHAATAPLQHELANHPITISGQENAPLLRLDSGLLAQALGNVLHNATIYAPDHTPIEITITIGAETLEIRVRDHGPGIPEHLERLIFDKFYRSPNSPAGGTGLGLAIARGFLRALKGDITVENHPAGGAQFVLRLPVTIRPL
jgi:K+-sensing histidine kinase KdpD